jgi:hypothetical protein
MTHSSARVRRRCSSGSLRRRCDGAAGRGDPAGDELDAVDVGGAQDARGGRGGRGSGGRAGAALAAAAVDDELAAEADGEVVELGLPGLGVGYGARPARVMAALVVGWTGAVASATLRWRSAIDRSISVDGASVTATASGPRSSGGGARRADSSSAGCDRRAAMSPSRMPRWRASWTRGSSPRWMRNRVSTSRTVRSRIERPSRPSWSRSRPRIVAALWPWERPRLRQTLRNSPSSASTAGAADHGPHAAGERRGVGRRRLARGALARRAASLRPGPLAARGAGPRARDADLSARTGGGSSSSGTSLGGVNLSSSKSWKVYLRGPHLPEVLVRRGGELGEHQRGGLLAPAATLLLALVGVGLAGVAGLAVGARGSRSASGSSASRTRRGPSSSSASSSIGDEAAGVAARDVLELDLLLQRLDDGLAAVHQGELVELVLDLAELVV